MKRRLSISSLVFAAFLLQVVMYDGATRRASTAVPNPAVCLGPLAFDDSGSLLFSRILPHAGYAYLASETSMDWRIGWGQ